MLISTISFIECDKLSKEENENRLERCGQKIQNKIFNGVTDKITSETSPWTVYVEIASLGVRKSTSKNSSCSGTVISSRHVLTATHCISTLNKEMTKFLKLSMNDKSIEKKDCTGEDYIINDPEVVRSISIRAGKFISPTPGFVAKKIWLISACRKFENQDSIVDFALIEMENDFPFNSGLRPACVSESMSDVAGGVAMDFYGYGTQPTVNTSVRELQYEQTWVIQPRFVFRSKTPKTGKYSSEQLILARSISDSSVACPGDSGGGATRIVNGRTSLVAVISQTSCAAGGRDSAAMELYGAVASKSEKWCEYGGICSGCWKINHVFIGISMCIFKLIKE